MSKLDAFDNDNMADDIHNSDELYFDYDAFQDIFQKEPFDEYEFEEEPSVCYIPPEEGLILPEIEEPQPETSAPEPEASPAFDLSNYTDYDSFGDSGTYRSEDGISEFRSFDGLQPDISMDGWVHEPAESDWDTDSVLSEESEGEIDPVEENDIPPKPRHRVFKAFCHFLLGFVTFISLLYLVAVYSDNTMIVKLRNMYIQTAMNTLNHKWLATAIFPPDMIEDLMRMKYESENSMMGIESNWGTLNVQALPTQENATTELHGGQRPENINPDVIRDDDSSAEITYGSAEEEFFFQYFYQIDYHSMMDYLDKHPEVLDNGWYGININEAGLDDEGTSIKTIYGDQVLAINVEKGVILVRLNLDFSRGVMAICKDTSQLRVCAASTIGSIGQTAGRICKANDGLLAMTANGFDDPDGNGNGGEIDGVAVCSGKVYGEPIFGYKRIEIRDDNRMYIMDSGTTISSSVRDACEFTPALIIDKTIVVDENCGWTGPNPRTTIGQTSYLESVLIVVEGRFADSPGCSVVTVAEKMLQYGCVQAMNCDGGTSAIMYYDGEYITRCSNEKTPEGRPMPNAWVYG